MNARKKLLVVDDQPEIVNLIRRMFEARGFDIISGKDGQEALDLTRSERPDLLLLDLDLPRIDGFEVCRQLKADEATKKIPVVMMTAAHVTTEAAKRGVSTGADEYVAKPFLREVLVHNVERLLAEKRD